MGQPAIAEKRAVGTPMSLMNSIAVWRKNALADSPVARLLVGVVRKSALGLFRAPLIGP